MQPHGGIGYWKPLGTKGYELKAAVFFINGSSF